MNQRKQVAHKLQNPRINKITFHTLRHLFGSMEYFKTKDILHVKESRSSSHNKHIGLHTPSEL